MLKAFEGVPELLRLGSMGAFAILEFTKEEFLGEPIVWQPHANCMDCPVHVGLNQDGMDTGIFDRMCRTPPAGCSKLTT